MFFEFNFLLRNRQETRQNARNHAKTHSFSNTSWFQILRLDLVQHTVHGGFTSLHKFVCVSIKIHDHVLLKHLFAQWHDLSCLIFTATRYCIDPVLAKFHYRTHPSYCEIPYIFAGSQYLSLPSSCLYLILAKAHFLPITKNDQVLSFNKTPLLPHKCFYQNFPSASFSSHEY